MTSPKGEQETPMLDLAAQLASRPDSSAATTEGEGAEKEGIEQTAETDTSQNAVDALLADAGAEPQAPAAFEDADIEDNAPASPDQGPANAQESANVSEHSGSEMAGVSGDGPKDPEVKTSQPELSEASSRILLRQNVLELADELEGGKIGRRTAARRLREISEDDASALDADDIEVDFDAAPDDHAGMTFLAGLGVPKSTARAEDPVEAALLATIKLRDRTSALRIVGDTPGGPDREAYQTSLRVLRDALNTHLED